MSETRKFYKNKNILLTGCTGFVGQALVEKLLRSFPDIGKLFLIIRAKSGCNIEVRKNTYFHDYVFTRMIKENPNYLEKIEWIDGDLSLRNLGVSPKNLDRIRNELDIIIHNGASIKLKAKLGKTLQINSQSTLDMLDLVKESKMIKCFMYVSSSFVHLYKTQICVPEKLVPHNDPRKLLQFVREGNDDAIDAIFDPKFFGPYQYSKHVSENLIAEYNQYFPTGIFRPEMIFASYKDPVPYWINSRAGLNGFLNYITNGDMKVLQVTDSSYVNHVPIDFVTNCLLASIYDVAIKRYNKTPVIHYVSGKNRFTYKNAIKLSLSNIHDCRQKYGLQLNGSITFVQNGLIYKILSTLLHKIVAFFKDFICFAQGKPPRHSRQIEIMETFVSVLQFLLINEVEFESSYSEKLWQEMNQTDKELLFFNLNEIDFIDYYTKAFLESKRLKQKT